MEFESLLSQIEDKRPDLSGTFSLLRQFYKTGQEQKAAEEEPEKDNPQSTLLEAALDKQKRINRDLLQQYERIRQNYEELILKMDELAQATGSCTHCWGEDPACQHCRGRGGPGYFFPHQQYFECYVKPVILKLRQNKPTVNN